MPEFQKYFWGKKFGICWSLEAEKNYGCHKSLDGLFKPDTRVSTEDHKIIHIQFLQKLVFGFFYHKSISGLLPKQH